jgi:HK97 family phage portal protein
MVFGGNVEWEEMGISPRDMDFAAGKEDAARDICTSYGVPHILIVPGQSTYNNVREAKLELWEDTILPLIDKAVDALDAWLTPQFGDGLKLGVDLDEISALEPRRESKRKSVVELLDKGVIDADEAREALQYEPRAAEAVKKVDPPYSRR